jgi:hypothetical protein
MGRARHAELLESVLKEKNTESDSRDETQESKVKEHQMRLISGTRQHLVSSAVAVAALWGPRQPSKHSLKLWCVYRSRNPY